MIKVKRKNSGENRYSGGPVGLNKTDFRKGLVARGVGAIQTIYIQNNFFVTLAT